MADGIKRQAEVEALTGLSRTTIWRLERRGDFPRRRQLTGSITGWLGSEITAWIESRPLASNGPDEHRDEAA